MTCSLCFVFLLDVSNISAGNIMYVLLFGWWIAATYLLVAVVMAMTIIGWRYSKLPGWIVQLCIFALWARGSISRILLTLRLPDTIESSQYFDTLNMT